MFKAIKALFKAFISLMNIITGFINLGGDAMADASREYSDWSTRRQATKSRLTTFNDNFDALEELADKLQDIETSDIPEDVKEILRAEINSQIEQFKTAE